MGISSVCIDFNEHTLLGGILYLKYSNRYIELIHLGEYGTKDPPTEFFFFFATSSPAYLFAINVGTFILNKPFDKKSGNGKKTLVNFH